MRIVTHLTLSTFPHLYKLQTLPDVFDLLLVTLDHLLQLLTVHAGVNRIRDVGRRWGDAACCRHADPHCRDDNRGTESERCQDEACDCRHAAGNAGHPSTHSSLHRFLVELICSVGQSHKLQDATLQGRPALVEKTHEETGGHVDTIGCLLHRPAETDVEMVCLLRLRLDACRFYMCTQ